MTTTAAMATTTSTSSSNNRRASCRNPKSKSQTAARILPLHLVVLPQQHHHLICRSPPAIPRPPPRQPRTRAFPGPTGSSRRPGSATSTELRHSRNHDHHHHRAAIPQTNKTKTKTKKIIPDCGHWTAVRPRAGGPSFCSVRGWWSGSTRWIPALCPRTWCPASTNASGQRETPNTPMWSGTSKRPSRPPSHRWHRISGTARSQAKVKPQRKPIPIQIPVPIASWTSGSATCASRTCRVRSIASWRQGRPEWWDPGRFSC
mmetsp:Transcript_13410/g.31346  ORF Transcript_13410/g.31346 Transcript_13410/m.31346 type:complete len:260 (+) Transcript_13410:536-1315(+)